MARRRKLTNFRRRSSFCPSRGCPQSSVSLSRLLFVTRTRPNRDQRSDFRNRTWVPLSTKAPRKKNSLASKYVNIINSNIKWQENLRKGSESRGFEKLVSNTLFHELLLTMLIINGGASGLSTQKCLYESVETVPSGDGPFRRKQVKVIEPLVATGKLTCTGFIQQVKAYWLVQNRKWQPLVAQVRRLPSLRKGDSLKVGQPATLSSRMIGQPLSYWRKGLRCFHLLYKVKAGKALGVILRFSTRCYLTCRTFISIIQDHLPVAQHSVQDPIRHTCILSIVRTNKDIKRHHVYFIPDYHQHLVTCHLAESHTLHKYFQWLYNGWEMW